MHRDPVTHHCGGGSIAFERRQILQVRKSERRVRCKACPRAVNRKIVVRHNFAFDIILKIVDFSGFQFKGLRVI